MVGTGGASLRPPAGPLHPNAEVFDYSADGLLKLALHPGWYSWDFLGEPGSTFTDGGANNCHAAPDGTPPEGDPTLASSHGSNWSNDDTVQVTWSGASDSGSGVDGFSYEWSQSPTTVPDTGKDAEETATRNDERRPGKRRVVVPPRTGDNAGNWSRPVHIGPFRIDTRSTG